MRSLPAVLALLALSALACAAPADKDDDGTGSTDDDTSSADGSDLQAACEAYVEAYNACADDYAIANGVDPASIEVDVSSTCAPYADDTDPEDAALLNCYADIYASADCSTAEGWSAASEDFADCNG